MKCNKKQIRLFFHELTLISVNNSDDDRKYRNFVNFSKFFLFLFRIICLTFAKRYHNRPILVFFSFETMNYADNWNLYFFLLFFLVISNLFICTSKRFRGTIFFFVFFTLSLFITLTRRKQIQTKSQKTMRR